MIWDLSSRKKLHVIREQAVTDVAFSRDGRTLVTTQLDGRVVMWDVESGRELMSLGTDADLLTACELSPDGNTLAACSEQSRVWLWHVATMDEIDRHPVTVDALYQQGLNQYRDGALKAAANTLRAVLRMQSASLPQDESAMKRTRTELAKVLKEQANTLDSESSPNKAFQHRLE